MNVSEFLTQTRDDKLYMCECGDFIIWDADKQIMYSSVWSHYNGTMIPMVDFRYRHGHAMLWARQVELDVSCEQWLAEIERIYCLLPVASESYKYRAYELARKSPI